MMNTRAQSFIGGVVSAGLAAVVFALLQWRCDDIGTFATFLALCTVASALKLRIPGTPGCMTPGFVFVLMAIVKLSLPETVLICLISGLVQTLWRPKTTPKPIQVAFNAANLAACGALAHLAAHTAVPADLAAGEFVKLAVALTVLFTTNITVVSIVVCLLQGKPLRSIWQLTNYWTLPYYGMGTVATVALTQALPAGTVALALVVPTLYLIHSFYSVRCSIASK